MKHTPGPWKVRFLHPDDPDDDFFVEAPKIDPKHPYNIEILGQDTTLYPTRLQDAYLISAAPDLLESVEAFVKYMEDQALWDKCDQIYYKAKAAIKKANNQ